MQNLAFAPAEHRRHGLAFRIAARLLAGWQGWRQRRRARSTAHILHGLSDAALKDIGVHRSEIESVAAGCGRDRKVQRDVWILPTRG
jgi:uncharacterized protein YjiS (DUF1127 family)